MNVKVQHLLRTTSILLVLAVLLSGPVPSVTALEARQEPPPKLVVQGSGDFPRLPVVGPGADGITLALYLVEGNTATQSRLRAGSKVCPTCHWITTLPPPATARRRSRGGAV